MIGSCCRWVGRAVFAAIFILSAANHAQDMRSLSKIIHKDVGKLIAQVAKPLGVNTDPFELAAYGAVGLCGTGGLLIATGLLPRLGSVLVLAFLLPATYFQHFLAMQAATDGKERATQMLMVMKNASMMGAALMLFGYECAAGGAPAEPKRAPSAGAGKSKGNKKKQ
mmetsp:Transcript_30198/g.70228  ORF Transcript_30198/g.70228 Transcript_30198/m.70228 type:complete len:167 (+) Transcript_30198:61-561(+)